MRSLVTNSMLVNLKKARYEYCKEKSDCDSLVFDNLAFRDLIDELKGILDGKPQFNWWVVLMAWAVTHLVEHFIIPILCKKEEKFV